MEALGSGEVFSRSASRAQARYVQRHVAVGSAVPLNWCTLGGVQRCFLPHWVRVREFSADAADDDVQSAVSQTLYCAVCNGACASSHPRLVKFCRFLTTLCRDTARPLEEVSLLTEMATNFMCSPSFLGVCLDGYPLQWGTFCSELFVFWRSNARRVPSAAEVWNIATGAGIGALFSL